MIYGLGKSRWSFVNNRQSGVVKANQTCSAQRITSLYEVDDLALLSDSMGEGVLPRKIINLYHVKDFTFR